MVERIQFKASPSMIEILEKTKGNLLAIQVKGKLTKADYDIFNPILEKTIKDYKKPKLYCEIMELDMPTFKAIWEDIKNIPNYNKLEKCAVVGTKDWYEPMVKFFGKLISPEVRYFSIEQKDLANDWLTESLKVG